MLALAALTLACALPSRADVSFDDRGEIFVRFSVPQDESSNEVTFDGNPTFYRLRGQSAFIQSRTASGTSGGQLDGAVDLDTITFFEAFPETNLSDYLTYSYLGIVELVGNNTVGDEVILDTSLVIGFNGSSAASATGVTADSLYPYDEATLVDRFTNSFDSPEFLDMAFSQVGGQSATMAEIQLWSQTIDPDVIVQDPATLVRTGEQLTLIAFIDGQDGTLGREIGDVNFSMTRVTTIPEPAAALLGLAMPALLLRRRA
jgi:hypothetical protein